MASVWLVQKGKKGKAAASAAAPDEEDASQGADVPMDDDAASSSAPAEPAEATTSSSSPTAKRAATDDAPAAAAVETTPKAKGKRGAAKAAEAAVEVPAEKTPKGSAKRAAASAVDAAAAVEVPAEKTPKGAAKRAAAAAAEEDADAKAPAKRASRRAEPEQQQEPAEMDVDAELGAPAEAQGMRLRSLFSPTLQEVQNDRLTKLANHFWRNLDADQIKFHAHVVEAIYAKELLPSNFAFARVMLLEYSQYLERYLWPHFDAATASTAHVVSIVLMLNEKFRERVPAFDQITSGTNATKFRAFFARVLRQTLADSNAPQVQVALLLFLINCFQGFENDAVRKECLALVSPMIWHSLHDGRREAEFKQFISKTPGDDLGKHWNERNALYNKQLKKADDAQKETMTLQRTFMSTLIRQFTNKLSSITTSSELDEHTVRACDRFVELMIDLESQPATRRYLNTLIDDHQLLVTLNLSALAARKEGSLFKELTKTLKFYAGFEINDFTGDALTQQEMITRHTNKIAQLQRAVFKKFRSVLNDFALASLGSIDSREALLAHFQRLSDGQLRELMQDLSLRIVDLNNQPHSRAMLLEVLVARHERRQSQIDAINAMPLYPNEKVLWDPNSVKTDVYSGEHCLALPKLNLQFLTVHDYLLRNMDLFRLEANYEIRSDIEDVIERMQPRMAVDGSTDFNGWARMGVKLQDCIVTTIKKPNLGESKPSKVVADVTYSIGIFRDNIRREWEALRQHDVLFLVTVRANQNSGQKFDRAAALRGQASFAEHFGIVAVRGCEIEAVIGPEGKPLEEFRQGVSAPRFRGDMRTLRVSLDTNQFQMDGAQSLNKGAEDVYSTFNVLVRRKPKENNFKAVLETIRDLMQTKAVVPKWLHDVFLGYGRPDAASYQNLENAPQEYDFRDTFVSEEHLVASFLQQHVEFTVPPERRVPPFKISFTDRELGGKKVVEVTPYREPNRGPYPFNRPKLNAVPFTPTQVEAIKSGMSPGLTLIVGPPGTGKTDVAVQILNNIYHNFPDQHTLLITHSNQALNQIFEKVIRLDIDERHCVRLGHGEEDLQTEKDFSKYGRVDFFLQKRLELLAEVERLAMSLNIGGDHAYTCDTASRFCLYHIQPRWERFLSNVADADEKTAAKVAALFPFTVYFQNAPQPLFPPSAAFDEAMEIARGCYDGHLKNVFQQLDEIRAFELLRGGVDRGNFLLTKEAKIIAMTCTHAALKRRELVELAFKYDNIVMEEAAQILEVETFIPMLLQNPDDEYTRLKRVVLIGDHNQLPPVVKNMAFQRYGNMEQSLFTRFVRLGVPTITLDAQGRARPSLSQLTSWRYKQMGDLPVVLAKPSEFSLANAGFAHDYQLVNVEEFMETGEIEPAPHYYQNMGEAEYVVAVYQYMRLLGYPADRISMLTTYNGQRDLLTEVVQRRCAWNPLFGRPRDISTVDKFQGQQNDYILLSLVRTRSVGHLRDVRRLVVALSRARLGLYVFCRQSLFENCIELAPAFAKLTQRPTVLQLSLNEVHPTTRERGDHGTVFDVRDVVHMGEFVHQMTQEQTARLQAAAAAALEQQQQQQETAAQPAMETD